MLLYAQVSCVQTHKTLMEKRGTGILLVSICVFMAIYFAISMRFFKMMDIFNEKLFDMKIISANDFTIRIKMTDSMNQNFKKKYNSKTYDDPFIQSYEDDLSKKLEKYIKEKNPYLEDK